MKTAFVNLLFWSEYLKGDNMLSTFGEKRAAKAGGSFLIGFGAV